MAIRTQIRLDQLTGSISDGGSLIGPTIPYDVDSLQGSLDKLAFSVKAIHGGTSFANQGAGVFSQHVAITGSMGATAAVDLASTLGVTGLSTQAAINASGVVAIADSTAASSSTTGALKVTGGISTQADLYVGDDLNVLGDAAVTGLSTQAAINASGVVAIADSTAASSSTTGALKVTGGISTQADLYVGDDLNVGNDLLLTSDDAVLSMGVGADLTITHSGTGGTLAAASGQVDITAGAASVFKTTAGDLTIDSDAGRVILTGSSGPDSVLVQSELTVTGDAVFAGDLTVNGTTSTINSTVVSIGDNLMEMANANSANVKDLGWYALYNDGVAKKAGIYYDASESEFRLASELGSETGGVLANPTEYGVLRALDVHAEGTLDVAGISTFTGAIDANSTSNFQGEMVLQANIVVGTNAAINGDIDIMNSATDLDLKDNTAAALDITEDGNSYLKFDTTNGSEMITASKYFAFGGPVDINSNLDFDGTTFDVAASGLVALRSSGGAVKLADQYRAGSSWSDADGIALATNSASWSNFETTYGEISLLDAIVIANSDAGGTVQKKSLEIGSGGLTATNPTVGLDIDLDAINFTDMSRRVDVFVNGQLMLSGAAGQKDYELDVTSLSAVECIFTFNLLEDDVVQAAVR